jgi:hypothetical protein
MRNTIPINEGINKLAMRRGGARGWGVGTVDAGQKEIPFGSKPHRTDPAGDDPILLASELRTHLRRTRISRLALIGLWLLAPGNPDGA